MENQINETQEPSNSHIYARTFKLLFLFILATTLPIALYLNKSSKDTRQNANEITNYKIVTPTPTIIKINNIK